LLADALAEEPEPDRALDGWVRLLEALETPDRHVRLAMDQPAMLRAILGVLGRTRRAAELLLELPELPEWLHDPARLLEADRLARLERTLGGSEHGHGGA
jgi:glutamine synthetase adenylyltransferase